MSNWLFWLPFAGWAVLLLFGMWHVWVLHRRIDYLLNEDGRLRMDWRTTIHWAKRHSLQASWLCWLIGMSWVMLGFLADSRLDGRL